MNKHTTPAQTPSPYAEDFLNDSRYRADIRAFESAGRAIIARIEARLAREAAERAAQEKSA